MCEEDLVGILAKAEDRWTQAHTEKCTYQSFVQLIFYRSIGPDSTNFIETDEFRWREEETNLSEFPEFLHTVQIEDTQW